MQNCKHREPFLLFLLLHVPELKRFEYRSNREEAAGSGIFSGDDGYFEIYKKEKTD